MGNEGPASHGATSAADTGFELFKFFEEASQRAKSDAWSQTSWILTLSGGVLAFSMNLFVEHREVPSFLIIVRYCVAAGLILAAYNVYVLHQLAKHIRRYWTAANRLAARDEFLTEYIGQKEARNAVEGLEAPYPGFILRLFIPPLLFAFGHIGWTCHVLMVLRLA